jgi:hypothetical protein|uniref:Uncharacterized protein n=1 Tax=viral metagenome TaxID=1070528 RepID=A0A6C0ILM9_9ZZZZ
MSNLSQNGYILLKNSIDTNLGNNCLESNKIDYKCIYSAINRKYFPTIQKQIPDSDGASFRRFIFSNNSYSSMDSLYHANSYNHTDTNEIPIYCAYLFFSSTTLELIPGSHIASNNMNYGSKIQLDLQKGDVVVMNSNLHNRTINNGNSKILKIMDIFPNDEIKARYSHNFIVAQMNNSLIIKNMIFSLIFFSKSNVIMNFINYFYYFLVFYDLHNKFLLESINNKGKIVSYEANGRKYLDDLNDRESWNTYIITDRIISTQYFGNNLAIILFLSLILYCVFIYFSCKNKDVKECYKYFYETYTPKYIKDYMTSYKINPIQLL